MATAVEKLVSITEAARIVHMEYSRLRQICIDYGIAVEWAGGAKEKRYKVDMDEVDRVLLSRRTVARDSESQEQEKPQANRRKLNDRVRC
jgi:hypothetical protein